MTSWNVYGSNDGYSYFSDPCINCGGAHLWQHCHTCGVYGGMDGHWTHFPNSCSPSPSPYYNPLVVFDAYKNYEEEEHHAPISNMEKLILEHMKVTVQANTQEVRQGEENKLTREIIQFGQMIHDLQGLFNEKVEASKAKLQSVVDTS
ncbi:hypothetical protein HAX54_008375 [Datura stramonium]|uniref:Uncharacterized protein n=1 Tax=Datura stramonium TaxID=4076 RepID=A0ABS8TD66_DATST|nr:hypothetical protein [Datura stramonium]